MAIQNNTYTWQGFTISGSYHRITDFSWDKDRRYTRYTDINWPIIPIHLKFI